MKADATDGTGQDRTEPTIDGAEKTQLRIQPPIHLHVEHKTPQKISISFWLLLRFSLSLSLSLSLDLPHAPFGPAFLRSAPQTGPSAPSTLHTSNPLNTSP